MTSFLPIRTHRWTSSLKAAFQDLTGSLNKPGMTVPGWRTTGIGSGSGAGSESGARSRPILDVLRDCLSQRDFVSALQCLQQDAVLVDDVM